MWAPATTVLGGAVNTYGRILVRASRVGADTQLARMGRLVTDAQNGKASIQRLADRVSAVFVPAVLVIAALTLAALAAGRRAGVGGVHRRGRGADHRLPVRAGPGDTDGDPGRYRSRGTARNADQGSRRCSRP